MVTETCPSNSLLIQKKTHRNHNFYVFNYSGWKELFMKVITAFNRVRKELKDSSLHDLLVSTHYSHFLTSHKTRSSAVSSSTSTCTHYAQVSIETHCGDFSAAPLLTNFPSPAPRSSPSSLCDKTQLHSFQLLFLIFVAIVASLNKKGVCFYWISWIVQNFVGVQWLSSRSLLIV